MKFSTRTTYGLRAMIRLAQNYKNGSLSLPQISKTEHISLSYLERLFSRLKEAKLVKAEKGTAGGYKLFNQPDKTSIYDIVKILGGKMSAFYCLDKNEKIYCTSRCKCGALKVLQKVQQSIEKTLKEIKLSDLL